MIFNGAGLPQPNFVENRLDWRVALSLPGRCLLDNGHEFLCRTTDISPSGVGLVGPCEGDVDQRIVAYISQIGRVEGVVARRFPNGLGVKLITSPLKRERLTRIIASIVQAGTLEPANPRASHRIIANSEEIILRTPDGRAYQAELADVSSAGAVLRVGVAPPIGSSVIVGRTAALIARHVPGGVAVVFDARKPPARFDEEQAGWLAENP